MSKTPASSGAFVNDRVVLNTDIVIHLLKKEPAIVAKFLALKEHRTVFLISPIVVAVPANPKVP